MQEVKLKLREVHDQLEQIAGGLDALSTTIWKSIDHNNPGALQQGVNFKQIFNEKRGSLDSAIAAMISLLRDHPEFGPGRGSAPPKKAAEAKAAVPQKSEQSSKTVAKTTPKPKFAGDLESKAPFGFMLGEQMFTSASVWSLFYKKLLQEFYSRSPEKFSQLAQESSGLKFAGTPLFATSSDPLRKSLTIAADVYAESDLSAEDLLEVIKQLLTELDFPVESFKIMLKEVNRGTVETLSIAA